MTCGPLISPDWRNWVGSVYSLPTAYRKHLHPTPQTEGKRRITPFSSYLTPKHKLKAKSSATMYSPIWSTSPLSDDHTGWPVMKNIADNPHWDPTGYWRCLFQSITARIRQSEFWEEPQASARVCGAVCKLHVAKPSTCRPPTSTPLLCSWPPWPVSHTAPCTHHNRHTCLSKLCQLCLRLSLAATTARRPSQRRES